MTNELDLKTFCETADSKLLAAHIVVYRQLRINKELAKLCMAELSHRAAMGDEFDYEKYINEKLAEMPKPMNSAQKTFISQFAKSGLKDA